MSDGQCHSELLRLIWGFRTTRALQVVVSLGLADLLSSGPKASDELAIETKTHQDSLYRLMRAMASLGIFREDDRRCFSLAPLGEFLRTDIAGGYTAMAELVGQSNFQGAWSQLLYSVRTGARPSVTCMAATSGNIAPSIRMKPASSTVPWHRARSGLRRLCWTPMTFGSSER